MSRPTYSGGPAFLTHNAYAVQFADDSWSVNNQKTFFDITTNLQGLVGKRLKEVSAKVTGTPLGIWGASAITKLYPYQPGMRGQLLLPGTDLPLVIQTKEGKSITFTAAGLTQMPTAVFASDKTIFGQAEWTSYLAGGATGATAGDFVTLATSAYTEPLLTPASILTGRYTMNWGGLTNVETEAGITFSPKVSWEPVRTSNGGVVNQRLTGVTAEVTFTPVNLTEADLYNTLMPMDGTNAGLGSDVVGVAGALTVTGVTAGMPILTVPLAFCDNSQLNFGQGGRIGQIKLTAVRAVTSGVLQSLFALTTAA